MIMEKFDIHGLFEQAEIAFILTQQEIKSMHLTKNVYHLKELVEYFLSHLIDLIDTKILDEDSLEDILFSCKSLSNHLFNVCTEKEFCIINILIYDKLTYLKELAVDNELFESAQNVHKFQDMLKPLFLMRND